MALLLGTEYCKVDSNGRFKFPIAMKKQLETDDNRFAIRRASGAQCLELWTYDSFQSEVESLRNELNPYDQEDAYIMRRLTRANLVELDSNDRVMLPPEQKPVLGDAKEIVLQSTGKFIEIWGRSAYDKMDDNMPADDFAVLVDNRLGRKNGIPPASNAQ